MAKNKGGRPLKFKDPVALEQKIQEYFEYCEGHVVTKQNLMYDIQYQEYLDELHKCEQSDKLCTIEEPKEERTFIEYKKPTISGLALRLDCDVDTIKNYSRRDKFFRPIKRAYLYIIEGYEERLHGQNPAGAIFALKNFGWKDEKQVTGKDGGPMEHEHKITGIIKIGADKKKNGEN